MLIKLQSLPTWKKTATVLAGYALALAAAIAVIKLYMLTGNRADQQTYGAMFCFGNSVLFLTVFGVASLPATGLALIFLRGFRTLWIICAAAAVLLAATGLAALFALYVPYSAPRPPWFRIWEMISPLRALAAPVLAVTLFLIGLLSPVRWTRLAFFLTAVSELAVFGLVLLRWARPY